MAAAAAPAAAPADEEDDAAVAAAAVAEDGDDAAADIGADPASSSPSSTVKSIDADDLTVGRWSARLQNCSFC